MSARVVFSCDHPGCIVAFTMDSAHEHKPGCGADGCGAEANVPLDLHPVVRFLTDDPSRGGKGWEFALDKMGALLLVHKCFCPAHGEDIKALPNYKPDTVAKQHARRRQ